MQVFIQDIGGSRIENAAESTIEGIEIDACQAVGRPDAELRLRVDRRGV
jgi:hypothetical protein